MKILILSVLFLASCATRPPFQKLKKDFGYSVKDNPSQGTFTFDLEILLPESSSESFRKDYLARAAGEECSARNFPYFELGLKRTGGAKVFCFEKESRPHLAATLDPRVSSGPTPILRVEETEMGAFSPFKPWDLIRKVNGKPVRDLAELKEGILNAARQGQHRISVLVERSEIPLQLDCPIVDSGSGLMNSDVLKDLRTKIP